LRLPVLLAQADDPGVPREERDAVLERCRAFEVGYQPGDRVALEPRRDDVRRMRQVRIGLRRAALRIGEADARGSGDCQ
jgi:hypothetical protein